MSLLILMLCLAVQEPEASGTNTPKALESEEAKPREDALRLEGLNAVLKKVTALEEEVRELKKATTGAEDKGKPSGAQAQSDEEKKKKQMEEDFKKALGEQKPAPPPSQGVSLGGAGTLKLIDMAFDILAVGGTSSATEDEIRLLEAGGHDPKNRGFTVQNVELTFAGVVDPYLRGDANIVLQINNAGDTTIELEEAYLTTLEFPYNLQLKAGQYFSQFGRLNPSHPHGWDFVDQR